MAIKVDPPEEWEFDSARLGYVHKRTKAFLPERMIREHGWEKFMTKVKPAALKKIVCFSS